MKKLLVAIILLGCYASGESATRGLIKDTERLFLDSELTKLSKIVVKNLQDEDFQKIEYNARSPGLLECAFCEYHPGGEIAICAAGSFSPVSISLYKNNAVAKVPDMSFAGEEVYKHPVLLEHAESCLNLGRKKFAEAQAQIAKNRKK